MAEPTTMKHVTAAASARSEAARRREERRRVVRQRQLAALGGEPTLAQEIAAEDKAALDASEEAIAQYRGLTKKQLIGRLLIAEKSAEQVELERAGHRRDVQVFERTIAAERVSSRHSRDSHMDLSRAVEEIARALGRCNDGQLVSAMLWGALRQHGAALKLQAQADAASNE